ncbi:MAG: GNAT family N-acetyltransferase [Flammeovirgaceae bacterium]|nr:GNAT family N-acetyltransferase [Flammeovirgaceae bacterium]
MNDISSPVCVYEGIEFSIRSWKKGDEESLAYHANNKKIYNNLKDIFPHPYTIENANFWIELANSKNPIIDFAIVVEKKAIGGIGFIQGEDVYRLNMEIGFWIGEEFWGKGIMTLAVKQFVKWLFENFKVIRIYASVFAFNKGSMRVLEKASFSMEGRFKDALIKDNLIIDEYIFSILKSE